MKLKAAEEAAKEIRERYIFGVSTNYNLKCEEVISAIIESKFKRLVKAGQAFYSKDYELSCQGGRFTELRAALKEVIDGK